MIFLVIFLMCIFVTIGIGVLAGHSDFRTLTISNLYSVAIIGAFFLAYGAVYLGAGDSQAIFKPLWSHLLSSAIAFVVTLGLFALRMIGAGDSKFATACALWFGIHNLPIFLFYMTLGGAILGAVALYIQRKKPFKTATVGGWVDQVQGGASKVPYGAAIAFGMVIAFWYAGYFSADAMGAFLVPAAEASAS